MRALMFLLAGASVWAQSGPVFSTYLGGRELDILFAAAVDASGYVYLAGQTYSRDFPTAGPRTSCTSGPLGGCVDAFVTRLSPEGRLIYSVYYGTPYSDEATGIAPNPDGSAWVAGTANNAIFLLKLGPDGQQQFSRTFQTYPLARARAAALDRQGNVYVTGETLGPLPLVRPLQENMGAGSCTAAGGTAAMPYDAFAMKFSPRGELLYSTYFGGGGNDGGLSIAADAAGNIYIAGHTSSRDLPLANPAQDAYSGGEPTGPGQCEGGDGFIAKIGADGSRLVYSTYAGTGARDAVPSIHVSPEGYLTAVRSGAGALQVFDPEGKLLQEDAAPPSESVTRDRAGAIYAAFPAGYLVRDGAGRRPEQIYMSGLLEQSSLVSLAPGGGVLLAGTTRIGGSIATVNAIQTAFGGVMDGVVMLFPPPAQDCSRAVLVNAASYRGPYVAPESLATLFGCGLDGVTEVRVTDSAGASSAARILATGPGQLNLVLPGGLAAGPAEIAALRGDAVAAEAAAQVETAAPALFTAAATGEGAPAAVALRVAPDGSRTSATVPASGEIDAGGPEDRTYLLLFGTGIRSAGPAELSVRAGGVELPVLGHAAQSEFAGLDQVNVEVPPALSGAGAIDLQLGVSGKLANPVTIAVK